MKKSEPPSPKPLPASSLFLIGRDKRGNWVVQDQCGLYGGLFISRSEALKFAMFESGNKPQAVVMVPGVFELDMRRRPTPVRQSLPDLGASDQRYAA